MSKPKPLAYADATPEQLKAAAQVIQDSKAHRYYVSRVYTTYNAMTGKNEAPQTCSSCLRSRVREITKWMLDGENAARKASAASGEALTEGGQLTAEQMAALEARNPTEAIDGKPQYPNADMHPDSSKSFEPEVLTENVTAPVVAEAEEAEMLDAPSRVIPCEPVKMADGSTIQFMPFDGAPFEDGVKGEVATPDGGKVKAGTYKTAGGHEIRVQVGSRATYVEDLAS